MKLGLDVGSTTIKYVVLDDNENIILKDYKRHYSHIKENVLEIRVFDSWSSNILAIYRFLYTMYIRTFFIMSIFLFFSLLTVVKSC